MIVAKFLHAGRKAWKPAGLGADGGIVQRTFQRRGIKMAMGVIDMGKREGIAATQPRTAGTGKQAQAGEHQVPKEVHKAVAHGWGGAVNLNVVAGLSDTPRRS